ncbi:unnamed protein product, partial [Ceratitis capitata]
VEALTIAVVEWRRVEVSVMELNRVSRWRWDQNNITNATAEVFLCNITTAPCQHSIAAFKFNKLSLIIHKCSHINGKNTLVGSYENQCSLRYGVCVDLCRPSCRLVNCLLSMHAQFIMRLA